MTPEQAERKAKAERAKKLLAKRKKDKEGLAVSSKASSEIGSASPRASIDVPRPAPPAASDTHEDPPSESTKGEETHQNGSALKESTVQDELVKEDVEEAAALPVSGSIEELPSKEVKDEADHEDEVAHDTAEPAQQPTEVIQAEEQKNDTKENGEKEPTAKLEERNADHTDPSPSEKATDSTKPPTSTSNDTSIQPETEAHSTTNTVDKKSKKKKKKGKTSGAAEKATNEAEAEPEDDDEPSAVDESIVEQMMVDDVERQKGDEQENTAEKDQSVSQPKPDTVTAAPLESDSVPLPKQSSTPTPETTKNTEQSALLAAAKDEITDLKSQLDVLSHFRTAATQLEEETTTLRSTLDNYRERIERIETLEAECAERRAEVEALHAQLLEVENREEQARDEVRRVGREREDVEERAREAEERLERQRERESRLEVEVNRLKRERGEWQTRKEESEASLAETKEKHTGALEQLESLQKTHDSLQAEHETLQASLKSTTAELDSTRDLLSSATTARTASDARAEEQSASVSSLTEARDALQLQLGKESKRCEQAVTQRGALLQDNQGLLAQLEEMRERNGELMKDLVTVTEERDALQVSVKKLESKVEELKQAKETDDAETERFRREYEDETRLRKDTERDLQTTREMLEQQSKTHNEQLAELQPRLEALTVAHSEIERELDVGGSTDQGDDQENASSSAAVVGEIQNLKAEIKRLRDEMDEMRRGATATAAETQQEDPVALVQAQHALEISNYGSKLRSIESALHAESSRSHLLSKQITDLQAELMEAKRQQQQRDLHPSTSLSYRLAPTTTMIDEKLPPSVRQKRRTALALLKARLSAASSSAPGTPSNEADHRPDHSFRSQLSEDAVFWCPCCDGDLISL